MGGTRKYYAVRKGRTPGVYETWAECEAQVKGFPGAVYRAFPAREDAEAFVKGTELYQKRAYYAVRAGHVPGVYDTYEECRRQIDGYDNPVYRKFSDPKSAERWAMMGEDAMKGKACRAYVDGSYNPEAKIYGYGAIVLYGSMQLEFSGSGTRPSVAAMRQIGGEIEAALRAVREAKLMGFSEIRIFYDYMGIEKWVTGEWRATKKYTQAYAETMRGYMKDIQITFSHVKAHSGIKFNEMADQLAKRACGL